MSRAARLVAVALACAIAAVTGAEIVGGVRPAGAESPSDDESAFLVDAARKAIRAREYAKAGKLLDRALRVDPRRIPAYILRASVYGVLGKNRRAVAVMRRAQRLAPDNLDVLTALGSQLMLAKRDDEAAPMLERVVARDPRRYEAQVHLGHYYTAQSRWVAAIRAFGAYFASRPAVLARQDATHHVDLANAHLRSGDAETARDLYQDVLRADPDSVLGRLGLAWSVAAIDCRRALPLLEELTDIAEQYAEVSLVEGRCRLALGQVERALSLAARYRERRPADAHGLVFLGDSRAAVGDRLGAFEALSAAVGREPRNKRFAMKLARIERIMGHAQAAAARLRAAGPALGSTEEWTVELGEALLADGQHAKLRDLMAPHVDSHPDDAGALLLLGSALMELGDVAGAAEHLRRAVELDPEATARVRAPLVAALNVTAMTALDEGDFETAEARLVLAASLRGDDQTLRNLGAVLVRAGKASDAIAPLERASAAGNDYLALHLLGRAYAASGRLPDARTALEGAREVAGSSSVDLAPVTIDLAAVLLEDGRAEEAVALLEPALAAARVPADAKRLADAYYAAVVAAMTQRLGAGAFRRAYRLGTRLEPYLAGRAPSEIVAVRCSLALASTGAGMRDKASQRLRSLEREHAVCPFAAPADELAIPILQAWNEGRSRARARKALAKLDRLRRKATGPAEPLVLVAYRDVAMRAAAEAYQRDDLKQARAFLAKARRIDRGSPEVDHNEAVLLLAAGRKPENAIAQLLRVADAVPEAHVSLGIAYERLGERVKALEHFQKAVRSGVRHAGLDEWIAIKRRIWGGGQ